LKVLILQLALLFQFQASIKINIDVVIQYLCKLPIPKRDFVSPPRFIVVRGFDINKPGIESKNLKGDVAGGTLISILKVGEVVEIKPRNNRNK
jgi:translation initiation factor 2 subunit 3